MGESKARISLGLDKRKMERHNFYIGGYRIVNIYSARYVGNKITTWSHALVMAVVPYRGLEKKNNSDISKVCYLRGPKTTISKVEIDFHQGSYRPRM